MEALVEKKLAPCQATAQSPGRGVGLEKPGSLPGTLFRHCALIRCQDHVGRRLGAWRHQVRGLKALNGNAFCFAKLAAMKTENV